MADVLEHLRRADIVLRRLKDLLEPGGSLILSVPNIAHWTTRVGLLMGRFEPEDKGILDSNHVRFFTRRSISRLLRENHYEITQFEAMYIFPLHHRHGLARFFAKRGGPDWIKNLFGYQFIVEAKAI